MPVVTGGNQVSSTDQIVDGIITNADVATNAAIAGSKINADDTAYGASWNGSTKPPTQNAVYDKIETLSSPWYSVSPSEVTVAATVTKTALYSVTVPGGTLSTNKAVLVKVAISDYDHDNAGNSVSFILDYGATTIATMTMAQPGNNIANAQGIIEALLVADGATNAQKGLIQTVLTADDAEGINEAVVGISKSMGAAYGTAAEDSTADKTLTVSVQWAGAGAGTTITAEFGIAQGL